MRSRKAGQVRQLVLIPILLGLAGSRASADPLYAINDLGTLPGTTQSVATGINSQGQVVGISYNAADGSFADSVPGSTQPPRFQSNGSGGQSFLYSNGQIAPINPIGGLAMSINDSGQAVGGQYSSINNSGQYVSGPGSGIITGDYSGSGQLTSSGTITNLGLIPYAINNAGQIAGFEFRDFEAAISQNGQVTRIDPSYFEGKREFATRAVAINQSGDLIINTTAQDFSIRSYLYHAATQSLTELSTLPGGAGMVGAALNDKDQIVGNGFLYSNGTIQALASLLPAGSGWSNLNATAINDAGQIVGQGTINGQEHAFLMTLDPGAPTPVPEPSTLVLLGTISLGFAARRVHHRLRRP